MRITLEKYKSVADAIAALFRPNAEVVIHDVGADKIFHISNPVSGRSIGDSSYLESTLNDIGRDEMVIGPYENAGKNGQRVRSVTAVLRNDESEIVGLMCINLDYSGFEPALELLESLIRPPSALQPPEILFQNDWRDQLKLEVRRFFESRQLTQKKLSPQDRKELLAEIEGKRLLFAKNSVEQLATILNISRATVYNDLKKIRSNRNI